MPLKLDLQLPRSLKWKTPQPTSPLEGKQCKLDDLELRSTHEPEPNTQTETTLEKITKPFKNASRGCRGLFRRKNGCKEQGGPGLGDDQVLEMRTCAFPSRVDGTPGMGELRIEDFDRGRGKGYVNDRRLVISPRCSTDGEEEVRDPFRDPSREGSFVSRWSVEESRDKVRRKRF